MYMYVWVLRKFLLVEKNNVLRKIMYYDWIIIIYTQVEFTHGLFQTFLPPLHLLCYCLLLLPISITLGQWYHPLILHSIIKLLHLLILGMFSSNTVWDQSLHLVYVLFICLLWLFFTNHFCELILMISVVNLLFLIAFLYFSMFLHTLYM